MRGIEHSSPMRIGWNRAQQLLLRAMPGKSREPGSDASFGRDASGTSGLRKSAIDASAETGRHRGQPQASESIAGDNWDTGDLSTATDQHSRSGPSNLPLPSGRPGNMRSESEPS